MNEFIIEKLEKAVGFGKNFEDTILKSKESLKENFLPSEIDTMIARNSAHITALVTFAKTKDLNVKENLGDDFFSKLTDVKNIITGEALDEKESVFEWFGYSSGGALLPWNSLKGSAETLVDDELLGVIYDAISFHEEIVDYASTFLIEDARRKSKS